MFWSQDLLLGYFTQAVYIKQIKTALKIQSNPKSFNGGQTHCAKNRRLYAYFTENSLLTLFSKRADRKHDYDLLWGHSQIPSVLKFTTSFMPAKITTSPWKGVKKTQQERKKLNQTQPKNPRTLNSTSPMEINCNKWKVVSGNIPT